MASTPVQLQLPSGLTATLSLYAAGSDTLANSGGADTLTEATNAKGLYTATVTEALSGVYFAKVLVGSNVVGTGWVALADDTTTYRVVDSYLEAQRLDASITSRLADADYTEPPTAAEIEAALVNDGDATALLQAIADKIESEGITTSAIAAAVWAYTVTAGGSADAALSSAYAAATAASGSASTLLGRLSADRAGYLDKLNVSGTLAHTDNASSFMADVSGLPSASAISTQVADDLAQAHGNGPWTTATGFATPGDVQVTVEPTPVTVNPTVLDASSVSAIAAGVWAYTAGDGRTLSSFDFEIQTNSTYQVI